MPRLKLLCLAIVVLTGIVYLSSAAVSSAQIPGNCNVSLNGISANYLSTPGTALEVPFNGSIFVNFSSTEKVTGHDVTIEFIGAFPFEAARGVDDGTTWSQSVDVARYARFGVGMYRVTANAYGPGACTRTGYVVVTGKNPLTTPVGAGAAAATAIGAAGLIGAAAVGSKKGPELASAAKVPANYEEVDMQRVHGCLHLCLVNVPLALLKTGAFMVCGAGGIGAPAVSLTPYFSIVSILASLLTGIGTLILGQQYGSFFPSLLFSAFWLAGWVAAGVVITLMSRLIAVRKANAILAEGMQPGEATNADAQTEPEAETQIITKEETDAESDTRNNGDE